MSLYENTSQNPTKKMKFRIAFDLVSTVSIKAGYDPINVGIWKSWWNITL